MTFWILKGSPKPCRWWKKHSSWTLLPISSYCELESNWRFGKNIFSLYSKNEIFLMGCLSPIWLEKKTSFIKKKYYFLKDFLTISYPNIGLLNFKRSNCGRIRKKNHGLKHTSHHTFVWPYESTLNTYAPYFVMNGCISLKFL